MKQMRIILTAIIVLAIFFQANAQTDSTAKKRTQFKLSINYNTGLNYYGRTDSLKSSGFFPLAELWFTPDFYINAAPVFVNNSMQRFNYAGTVTTLGYQHVSGKWLTNIYVMKPFYKQSSELVQSALKAQTGLNLSFLNKVLNINGGADVKYSDKLDYGTTAGFDHIFRISFKNNSTIVVDPSFTTSAGTQNFTNTYYQKTKGFLFFPGSTQQVSQNTQQFNILAYEFSLPFIYIKGHWQLLITPSFVMPQNLLSIPNHPELSERGTDLFYSTIAAKYLF